MTSIGTLFAFVVVCAAVLVLRVKRPDAVRPFRVPFGPVFPVLGILSCFYLMLSLPVLTWVRFLVWLNIGMVIYWFYGRHHSPLRDAAEFARRSTLEGLGNFVTVAGALGLFNGFFMTVLGVHDPLRRDHRDDGEVARDRGHAGAVSTRWGCTCSASGSSCTSWARTVARAGRAGGDDERPVAAAPCRTRLASRRPLRPPRTTRWWLPGPGLAIGLLGLVLVAGTLGYVVIEGWSWWDALYMTVITVTTVGYREVHTLTWGGEAFTVVLLIGGVGTALYTFTLLATLVVEGGLHLRFEQRRIRRMIDELHDHFILCGYGRIGSTIAQELRSQGVPFVVVDRNPERVHEVIASGMLAVEADASREEVLRRLGIDRARALIAAVGTDAENVYAVLTARGLAPHLFIVGRAESEDAGRKLLRAGANRVVSPYHIGATQMAQTAMRPAVVDFVQLATSSGNLELAMEQVKVGPESALSGRTLVDANLRQRFGVIVVGIQRSGGQMEFNPSPEVVMRPGDDIVVLGRPASLRELEAVARTVQTDGLTATVESL